MADAAKVLSFRRPELPVERACGWRFPKSEKPVVRWAFSRDLQTWIASANGTSIAAVFTGVALHQRLDELSIYEALFRGVR